MRKRWLTALLVAGLMPGPTAHAADRIVFLTVRFNSTGVSLESTSVVAGKLKSKGNPLAHGDQLTLRVLDQNSSVLHTQAPDC